MKAAGLNAIGKRRAPARGGHTRRKPRGRRMPNSTPSPSAQEKCQASLTEPSASQALDMDRGGTELTRYDAARHALAEALRVDEVKDIRDKAVAMQVYAKQAKDRTLFENATEIRMRAERRAGELLREMEKNKGAAGGGKKDSPRGRITQPRDSTLKLSDLKLTKSQSSRWQRLANMDIETFELRVENAKRKAVNSLDGAANRTRQGKARAKLLRPIAGTFMTLVVDLPLGFDWISESARATPGYATMTPEQLLGLPFRQWAAEQCHLYLWSPNNFMPLCFRLAEHWGFAHKGMLTWRKPRWGQGQYFRNQTEHVLFAVKGKLRTRSDSISTIFDGELLPDAQHSGKPERFYQIVRAASYPPYGEAFQCRARPDFVDLFAPIRQSEAPPPDSAEMPPIPDFLLRQKAAS
jgi:N6-adenosine-specific RNA methylase IME4